MICTTVARLHEALTRIKETARDADGNETARLFQSLAGENSTRFPVNKCGRRRRRPAGPPHRAATLFNVGYFYIQNSVRGTRHARTPKLPWVEHSGTSRCTEERPTACGTDTIRGTSVTRKSHQDKANGVIAVSPLQRPWCSSTATSYIHDPRPTLGFAWCMLDASPPSSTAFRNSGTRCRAPSRPVVGFSRGGEINRRCEEAKRTESNIEVWWVAEVSWSDDDP